MAEPVEKVDQPKKVMEGPQVKDLRFRKTVVVHVNSDEEEEETKGDQLERG